MFGVFGFGQPYFGQATPLTQDVEGSGIDALRMQHVRSRKPDLLAVVTSKPSLTRLSRQCSHLENEDSV